MAIDIEIALKKNFKVPVEFDTVFDTLADVPYSAGHFPKVDELVDLGDECYRWEMEKIGLDRWFIQTVYTSEYTWDKDDGLIEWAPVEDDKSNAEVEGSWTLKPLKEGTSIKFETYATLHLPLPGLAKMVVAPLVRREFEGLFDQYIANLKETWGC